MKILSLVLSVITAIPSLAGDNQSTITDQVARLRAVSAIRAVGVVGCLDTRRQENIEARLFETVNPKIVDGKLNQRFFVYEVMANKCYEVEGNSLFVQSESHPGSYGYVVVNTQNEGTYRLWSGDNAGSEFNRLMLDAGAKTTVAWEARNIAMLYQILVWGPSDGVPLHSEFDLLQSAQKTFYAAYSREWNNRFQVWWSRFKKGHKPNFDIWSHASNEGWIVGATTFKGFRLTVPRTKISGVPTVEERSLLITKNGQVTELPSRVLFK